MGRARPVGEPSPAALAATWDEDLVEKLGGVLASEARRKGVDVLLAPTVNLHRTPYAGRHFECFSEDPLLTARIGVSYVCGVHIRSSGAVVQLHASRPASGVERPVRWLVGFAAVVADPGGCASAVIIIPPRAFEHWSVQDRRWALEPGTFDLARGPSSAVLPLSAPITFA